MVGTLLSKVALVTGASRGLGLAVALALSEKWVTYFGVREPSGSLVELCSGHDNRRLVRLDVDDACSVNDACRSIFEAHGRVDALVNNAGVYLDDPRRRPYESILSLDLDLLQRTINTNLLGAARVAWRVIPTMKTNNFGRVVNISSGLGRIGDFDRQSVFYRVSKLALNGLTCSLAEDTRGFNIQVNSFCPGWIKTDMGGKDAPREVDQAVGGILRLLEMPSGGPSGRFLRDSFELDFCRK